MYGTTCHTIPGVTVQLLTAMAASLGYLSIGLVRGYSSPGVPSMNATGHHDDLVPNDEVVSWVSSIPPLGAFVGSLAAGPFLQSLGRKRTLMISSPLFVLGWLLIGFSRNLPMLLSARILTGVCAGIVTPSAQVYVSECSHAKIRGVLGSLPGLFMAGGVLLSYIMGKWLQWNWLAWGSAILPGSLFFVLLPLPESPSWLLARGRTSQAEKSLQWLRSSTDVDVELQDIKKMQESSNSSSEKTVKHFSREALLRRPVLVPLGISIALMAFQQLSGIDAIIFYTVAIFQSAQVEMDEHFATILVGLVQFLATGASVFFVDKYGRRPLLIVSGAVMAVSMAILGTYFYLETRHLAGSLGVVPIVSMMLFMVGFSIGYCSIPFLMMGELFPMNQRSLLSAVSGSFNLGITFVVIKTFPNLKSIIGSHGAFWLYAVLCFLSCLFVAFFVPETKGKTLEEIEQYFEDRSRERKAKTSIGTS